MDQSEAFSCTERQLPLDGPLPREFALLLRLWLQARDAEGGRMPGRERIDPVAMAPALGRVSLLDVLPDGGFVLRLHGSEHNGPWNFRDRTGSGLESIRPRAYREIVGRHWRLAAASSEPLVHELEPRLDGLANPYSRMALPYAGPDGKAATIVLCSRFSPDRRMREEFWRRARALED